MATNPFGQSPFGGAAAGKTDEKQSKQDLPYTATGIASRDNVRKMIWEIFEVEPDMNSAALTNKEIVDQLETALFESTGADAKTREYREKTNSIKLKLKGPSFQETRTAIRMGELSV